MKQEVSTPKINSPKINRYAYITYLFWLRTSFIKMIGNGLFAISVLR